MLTLDESDEELVAGDPFEVIVDMVGRRWRARGPGGLELLADDLDDLEERLRQRIVAIRRPSPGSIITIDLRCDNSMIPDWMRPYSSHYFNRVLTFEA